MEVVLKVPSKGGTFIHEKLLHLSKSSDDLWLLSKEPFPAACSVRCKRHSGDRLLVPQCCAGVGGSWHCHFPAALGCADLLSGRCGPEGWSALYPAPACGVGALPRCSRLTVPCWERQPKKVRGLGSGRSEHSLTRSPIDRYRGPLGRSRL